MDSIMDFPKRTIHLDFHTGPGIPDIGKEFNAREFARRIKEAHVDSVTLFAMCHHGHLYYNTDHPSRHPGLPRDLNLLEEQVEALHREGIRTPIYLSVLCNEFAANAHPEWVALTPDGRQVKISKDVYGTKEENRGLLPGWRIMDMASPYQDFLADILAEVLEKFAPTDGIFMDMCWDQVSSSKWFIDAMVKQNLDPRIEIDRNRYSRELSHSYMKRYTDMVEEAHKKHSPAGIWYNARPKENLLEEKKFLRHIEIEALPTGGWGYAFFPYVARMVRPLGLPTLSHTGRFFKSWGDNTSLKPEAALKYECCQILSQGMTNGVGDLLHPNGMPSAAVYDLIGTIYGYIESCEPYQEGGELVSQIGVLVNQSREINPGHGLFQPGIAEMGITRMLQQLRQQFDVIPMDSDFAEYEVLILLESTVMTADLREKLELYIQNGGGVILCGPACLDDDGLPVLKEMGIKNCGPSPYSHTFLHAVGKAGRGLADYGYVMYEPGFRMKPSEGSESLVDLGEPYFERDFLNFSGHEYTPEEKVSEYSAVVRNGRVISFCHPVIEAYGKHAAPNYRTLFGNCLEQLLPAPIIRDKGPSKLETTVIRTDSRTVVHLLSFYPERRAENLDIVEDALPLVDMPISIKSDRKPGRVYLAPRERDLDFKYEGGYVHTKVTVVDGHAMLILE